MLFRQQSSGRNSPTSGGGGAAAATADDNNIMNTRQYHKIVEEIKKEGQILGSIQLHQEAMRRLKQRQRQRQLLENSNRSADSNSGNGDSNNNIELKLPNFLRCYCDSNKFAIGTNYSNLHNNNNNNNNNRRSTLEEVTADYRPKGLSKSQPLHTNLQQLNLQQEIHQSQSPIIPSNSNNTNNKRRITLELGKSFIRNIGNNLFNKNNNNSERAIDNREIAMPGRRESAAFDQAITAQVLQDIELSDSDNDSEDDNQRLEALIAQMSRSNIGDTATTARSSGSNFLRAGSILKRGSSILLRRGSSNIRGSITNKRRSSSVSFGGSSRSSSSVVGEDNMINEVNEEKDTTEDGKMMMMSNGGSKVGTKVTNNVGDEKSTDYISSEDDKKEEGAEEEQNNTNQSRPQSPNINHNIRRHSHQRIGRRRSDMSNNNGTTSTTRRRSSLFAVDEIRQSLVHKHSPSPSTDKDSISTPHSSMGNSMTNSLQESSTSVGGSLQGSFSSDYDNAAARKIDGNSLICSFGRMDSSISNSSFNSVDYVNNNSLIVGWDRQVSMLSTESSLEECHGASNVTFPSENLGVATSPGGAMFDPTDLMR